MKKFSKNMFSKNKLNFKILFLLIFLQMNSQESLPFYQQYLISDKVLINPSYTGENDYLVLNGTYHQEWSNYELSPNTVTISSHAKIYKRLGFGAYFYKDRNGPVSLQGANFSAAYHIPLADTGNDKFSFGTSVSLFSQHYDWSKILPEESNDPLVYTDPSIFLPYLNIGVNIKLKRAYLALSYMDIPLSNNSPVVNSIEPSPSWFYGLLGYDWMIDEKISLEPSVLLDINTNKEKHLDLNLLANLHMNTSKFSFGFNYKTDIDKNDTQKLVLSPIVKASIGRYRIGISYNIGLSDIARAGGNGFSIGLGYNFDNYLKPIFEK